MPIELPTRLSYSSLNMYAECGEKWKLARGYHLDKETWFASVAGSAIHNITERWDLTDTGIEILEIPTFKQEFDRLLEIEEANSVRIKPSGKKLLKNGPNGGPNKKDYDWWLDFGPPMIERWMQWKQASDWFLLEVTREDPTGDLVGAVIPAVELPFEVNADGHVVRGYIDRVYGRGDGKVVVLDLKTGALPSGHLQLATYRLGLLRQYGIDADYGTYWIGKDGELTSLIELRRYSLAYLDNLYNMAWRGINAGIFIPNVSSMCRACPVRDYCRAVAGPKAVQLPLRDKLVQVERDDDVWVRPGVEPDAIGWSEGLTGPGEAW
jgi:hypothetical protein